MYINPSPMYCERCGYEGQHSPHAMPVGSILLEAGGIVCPVCFEDMIMNFCGVLKYGKPNAYSEDFRHTRPDEDGPASA